MKILNIGCGTKTSSDPSVINLDWSMYLRIKSNPVLMALSRKILSKERLERLDQLPSSIMVHDLRKGIPFDDNSIDAVYHSHFLEHLDRPIARLFMTEVKRVLRPGGIQRIAIPDMERLAAAYLAHLKESLDDPTKIADHDRYMADMIEQMVRREAFGTSQQTPNRRRLEKLVLGDARQQGQTHQWMYDRVNLPHLLREVGYQDVRVERFDTSRIPRWNEFGLDRNDQQGEYKPESLYVEAVK
jgi:predicted SAM-dependent methyltransferase